MYGYCHVIAVVMLDFVQRIMPQRSWRLYNGEEHTVVIDSEGIIVDINASHSPPDTVIDQAWTQCLKQPHAIYEDVDLYIASDLQKFPFGAPRRMNVRHV
tara:strand:- start:2033 stop:2332 length:300 start_codon:yes stop_codon:yes gene_type:complete